MICGLVGMVVIGSFWGFIFMLMCGAIVRVDGEVI
jgi:hypothetical protein